MPEIAQPRFYLLDTHVLYWAQVDSPRLSRTARRVIDEAIPEGRIAVSIFSLYELGQMLQRGRISSESPILDSILALTMDIPVWPITPEIVSIAVQLPASAPRDPGDRLIMATAIAGNADLITADHRILSCGAAETIW